MCWAIDFTFLERFTVAGDDFQINKAGLPINNEPQIDLSKLEQLQQKMFSEQNLVLGIIGAVAAALIGATLWAVVTVMTGYQIGWMAVGVGFLVGLTVRALGKGVSQVFGLVGAVGALGGCVLGNLLSTCGFAAKEAGIPFMELVPAVLLQPAAAAQLLQATFSPIDLLFYGIAVYEGYKFSFRQATEQDLASL